MKRQLKPIFYVYRHRRLDDFSIFYIGIGYLKNYKRAFSKENRNRYWKNIVNKHGYQVEIIAENLTKEEACDLEIFLILQYGRKDLGEGRLVNMTSGGEGTFGRIMEDWQRQKLREERSGENGYWYGKRGDELPWTGRKITEQERKERSIRFSGENNPMYGHSWSDEAKKALSEKKKGIDVHTPEHWKMLSELNKGAGNPNSKKVLDKATGVIYDCKEDAAKAFNIHQYTLGEYLNGKYTNKTSLVWLEESLRKEYNKFNFNMAPDSEFVLDTATGVFYYSIKEAAQINNLIYSSLRKMLRGKMKNKTILIIV